MRRNMTDFERIILQSRRKKKYHIEEDLKLKKEIQKLYNKTKSDKPKEGGNNLEIVQ